MSESKVLAHEQEEEVRQVVTEACVDMLGACGLPVGKIAAGRLVALSEHDLAGFIGFTGRVRGSLIMAASSRIFSATFPSMPGSRSPTQDDLLDWVGEMANQTLGRIKRRFCERGMDFETSTPTALKGRHIGVRNPPRDGIIEVALTVGEEVISICFEIEAPPGGLIFKTPAEPIECSTEGDLVLF
jgi:CheY-specific phosphatase CheX